MISAEQAYRALNMDSRMRLREDYEQAIEKGKCASFQRIIFQMPHEAEGRGWDRRIRLVKEGKA